MPNAEVLDRNVSRVKGPFGDLNILIILMRADFDWTQVMISKTYPRYDVWCAAYGTRLDRKYGT